MNFKRSTNSIENESGKNFDNEKELVNAKEYPTIADLMREQQFSKDYSNAVHHRRDLDSLG